MDRYRVKPGTRVHLADWDPSDTSGLSGGKKQADEQLLALEDELADLQELLYAEHKHKVLIILQAMDTGGKDGTIRHVFHGVNPQGVSVTSFKTPTPRELDHDYLWRVHACMPGKGEIAIFNRSHYEDVLIVRVHDWVSPATCRRRYAEISHFEQELADEGTAIIKFFLHIDKDEQRRRLQSRLDDPQKHWKFNVGDLNERKLWPAYIKAYEDAIAATSTSCAPWYIVPANHKWYRNWVVSRALVKTLRDLKMEYPKSPANLKKVKIGD